MSRLVGVNERGHRVGEDNPSARYTDRDVELVFELAELGWRSKRIGKKLECSRTWVRRVLAGEIRTERAVRFKRV